MRPFLTGLIFLVYINARAQSIYGKGDIIEDFIAQHLLNYTTSETNFNSLKKELTILDFFGTWCAPCIKALPMLETLKQKYVNRLSVILISSESTSQLNKFILAQKKLPFPVIVDSDKSVFNLFKPTSYPYTIVIDQNNKIVLITEVAEITEKKINVWFSERALKTNRNIKSKSKDSMNSMQLTETIAEESNNINAMSEQLIYAAKTGNETALLETQLKNLNFDSLSIKLSSDDDKKAFWINIYNGFTQLLLKKDPGKYSNRNNFFKAQQIEIAGRKFSLDNIEHGILRRSKIKWSLGYLNKLFTGKTSKVLRVRKLDYRIHFALNCGAKSCPPIAFYEPAKLQNQLDVATKSYLTREAVYNTETNSLQLPAIMSWFRHDFKGRKGMKRLVKKYNIIPGDKNPNISFKKYNWNLYLNNYNN